MCEPTTLTVLSIAASTASAAAQHKAQNDAAKAQNRAAKQNRESAIQAQRLQQDQEALRVQDLRLQNATQKFSQDRASRREISRVRAGAAERGGTGLSTEGLIGQLQGQNGEASNVLAQQLQTSLGDSAFRQLGLQAQTTDRINSVQSSIGANGLGTALNIGGGVLSGIQFGQQFKASSSGRLASQKASIRARGFQRPAPIIPHPNS